MDYKRISGTEPSSMILSQIKKFQKLKSDIQKVPKLAEAKNDGVKFFKKNTISINLHMGNFEALKTLRIDRSRP